MTVEIHGLHKRISFVSFESRRKARKSWCRKDYLLFPRRQQLFALRMLVADCLREKSCEARRMIVVKITACDKSTLNSLFLNIAKGFRQCELI